MDYVDNIKPFTAFTYKTTDGETITATKNNGIVTLIGDKNGVRQMSLDDFKREFLASVPKMERVPNQDTVTFKTNGNTFADRISYRDINIMRQGVEYSRQSDFLRNYVMDAEFSGHPLDNFHLKIENKLVGRRVTGKLFTKDVDLKMVSQFNNLYGGTIAGVIDGQKINVKYKETDDRKGFEIVGDLKNVDEIPAADIAPVLALLAYDQAKQCSDPKGLTV